MWRGSSELYNGDGLTHAASIAYYALLVAVPVPAADAVAARVGDGRRRGSRPGGRVRVRMVPAAVRVHHRADRRVPEPRRCRIGVGGVIGLVWASLGVFNAVTAAVNHAWAVEKRRSFLKHRLVGFLMLLSAGGILFVAIDHRQCRQGGPDPVVRRPRGTLGDAGLGVGAGRQPARDTAADRLRRDDLLFHPEHAGPLPRRVAGSHLRRPAVAGCARRRSPGTPGTWPRGTSSTVR